MKFFDWDQTARYMNPMQHFMKNLTIIGGLLMVVGLGPGAFSFDAQIERAERFRG